MLQPSGNDKFVALATNKNGDEFPIAYGATEAEAREKGYDAKSTIEMAGGCLSPRINIDAIPHWLSRLVDKANCYDASRNTLQEWANRKGHERCWYYPDVFRKLAEILRVFFSKPERVTREEFVQGCAVFTEEEYGPEPKDPDTVKLTVTMGFERRKEGVPFDELFERKCVNVLKHLLMYNIGAALSAEGLAHDVMPNYKKTKVETHGKRHLLPTVPPVEKNGERRDDPDKLDSRGVLEAEQSDQAKG